jgi:hypothetical protein
LRKNSDDICPRSSPEVVKFTELKEKEVIFAAKVLAGLQTYERKWMECVQGYSEGHLFL